MVRSSASDSGGGYSHHRISTASRLPSSKLNSKGPTSTKKPSTRPLEYAVSLLSPRLLSIDPWPCPHQPFGRIEDISRPQPVPAGALRSSTIQFRRLGSAVRAQNCLHGFVLPGKGSSTRISIAYEQALKAHVIRDWATNHPRIMLPILAFLLGTLTYTVCLYLLEHAFR